MIIAFPRKSSGPKTELPQVRFRDEVSTQFHEGEHPLEVLEGRVVCPFSHSSGPGPKVPNWAPDSLLRGLFSLRNNALLTL